MLTPPLSVIMPAYNEEGLIDQAIREVRDYVFAVVPEAEFILIDDGSRDRTAQIADEWAIKERRLRVLHVPNGGHGKALRHGLQTAAGERVLLLDSDCQIALDHFAGAWSLALKNDALLGMRRVREDPWIRRWITVGLRRLVPIIFGVQVHDSNCPFKIFPRSVWKEASPLIPEETLAPSILLAVFLRASLPHVLEYPIRHRSRTAGTSMFSLKRLAIFSTRTLIQMLNFRGRLKTWLKTRAS